MKNEQLSVLVGRSISSAIEDAEEFSLLHSGNWDSISKADEWLKESYPNNNNTILSSTVRDFKKFIGVGTNKDSTLLVNYAPKLFHAIRSSQGIRTNSYVFSMCHKKLKPKIFGASASGSYFFETYDNRYILKTITKRECDQLRHMLFDYWNHLDKYSEPFASVYGDVQSEARGLEYFPCACHAKCVL